MKFSIIILLIVAVAYFFTFSNKKKTREFGNLSYTRIKVGVKPGLLYKYLAYPKIEKVSDSIFYDSINNRTYFSFNVVRSEKQTVNVFSILSNDLIYDISPQKDTTFQFDDNLYADIKEGDLKGLHNLSLDEKDTIYIGYKMDGCWAAFREKLVLYKVGDNYRIEYSNSDSSLEKKILSSPSLKDKFKSFVTGLEGFLRSKKRSSFVQISTTTQINYIRKANTIYEFGYYDGYMDFKKEIGIN